MSRAANGLTTSYKTTVTHLENDDTPEDPRLFVVDGIKCAKLNMSRFCIRALLIKHQVVKWSDIKQSGRTGGTPEDALKLL